MSDESSDLLKLYDEEYNKAPFSESTIQLGGTLLDEIPGERRKIWRDMVENTNRTMNSKKALATIRPLEADNVSPPVDTTVTADQIDNQLLSNGRRVKHRRPPGEHHKRTRTRTLLTPKQKYIRISSLVLPFSENQKQIKSIIVHVT